MTTTEREDLENLIKSPGWQRVQGWARTEWMENIARHTEVAANATNDTDALNKLRQVIAAKKAVELVIDWPDQRLKALAQQVTQAERIPSLQRGGV